MARAPRSVAQIRWWPGVVCLGLAGAGAGTVGAQIRHGGLLPVAVSALTAAFVAIPLATFEWRAGPLGPRVPARARSLGVATTVLARAWGVMLVAAIAAPWVRAHGFLGAVGGILLWLGAAAGARRSGTLLAVAAAGALVVASVLAALPVVHTPPWTLLEPRWESWRSWLAPAVGAGFVLPAAGFGAWSDSYALPGVRRAAWLTAGAALLVEIAALVRWAVDFETGASGPVALVLPCAVAGACAVTIRDGVLPYAVAAGGIAATLWLAWPAHASLGTWWSSLIVVGPAVMAAGIAWTERGMRRVFCLFAAGVAVAVAMAGWPGLATRPGDAAAFAALMVAVLWVTGTAALSEAGEEE